MTPTEIERLAIVETKIDTLTVTVKDIQSKVDQLREMHAAELGARKTEEKHTAFARQVEIVVLSAVTSGAVFYLAKLFGV